MLTAKQKQEKVEAAIAAYMADTMNTAAGYDVMRYFSQGLVKFSAVLPGEYTGTPSTHIGFAVLRLTKMGKAYCTLSEKV